VLSVGYAEDQRVDSFVAAVAVPEAQIKKAVKLLDGYPAPDDEDSAAPEDSGWRMPIRALASTPAPITVSLP